MLGLAGRRDSASSAPAMPGGHCPPRGDCAERVCGPPSSAGFLDGAFFMHWLPVGRAPTGAGIRRHCAATEPRSLMRDAAHRCNARAVVAALHLPAETRGFDARVYRPRSDRRADSSMHLDVPCSRRLGRREAPKRLSARVPERSRIGGDHRRVIRRTLAVSAIAAIAFGVGATPRQAARYARANCGERHR